MHGNALSTEHPHFVGNGTLLWAQRTQKDYRCKTQGLHGTDALGVCWCENWRRLMATRSCQHAPNINFVVMPNAEWMSRE